MIGEYIWQKEVCEDGVVWVYVRCNICGHKRRYLETDLLHRHKHRDFTYVYCDRCKAIAQLKKELIGVEYASNEVFLK